MLTNGNIDFSTIQTMGSGASVSATARKKGVASVSIVTLSGLFMET